MIHDKAVGRALEHIIIIGKHYDNKPMTVADLREQYSSGCWKGSWPKFGYKALIKPFTYEEFNDLINRAIKFTEALGFKYSLDYFMGAPPPEPDYGTILRPTTIENLMGNTDMEGRFKTFQSSYHSHQQQMEEWAKARPRIAILTKEVYDRNDHIEARIKRYPDEPAGLILWIIKDNPKRITFHFYRTENDGNKKFCDEFLKLSTRYVLDDGW